MRNLLVPGLILFAVFRASGQQDFRNLDFELANMAPYEPTYPGGVPFSVAFPYWQATIGGYTPTDTQYNSVALDSPEVILYGGTQYQSWPMAFLPPALQGNYSAGMSADNVFGALYASR